MIASIGHLILILAFALTLCSATVFMLKPKKPRSILVASGRYTTISVFTLVSLAVFILLYSLLTHDFHMEYVTLHANSNLAWPYLISALWAGNAGAILIWAWLLSLFAIIVILSRRSDLQRLVTCASAVIMLIEAFLLLLLIFTSNPFAELAPAPQEGSGLNPLLRHPAMLFHPPLLLGGYAALAVPFALTVAALLTNQLGNQWVLSLRSWALVAWLLLGAGNLAGAWWAYSVMGWGGYWGWDPVENAGLMPWLVATALLHSKSLYRTTGRFKLWTVALVVLAFLLATFGAFLTRSGIAYSVHAFAESSQGPFFLCFMLAVIAASFALIYIRRHDLKGARVLVPFLSREGLLLITSLLLFALTGIVFEGTIFPAISELIRGISLHVGASFFNQVTGPIFLLIILLSGICTFVGRKVWKRRAIHLGAPLLVVVIAGAILYLKGIKGYALSGFLICIFAVSAIIYNSLLEIRARHSTTGGNWPAALLRLLWSNRNHYATYLCHIAVVIISIGIIGSSLSQSMVCWLWIGGGLLLLGGFICFTQRIPYDKRMGNRNRGS